MQLTGRDPNQWIGSFIVIGNRSRGLADRRSILYLKWLFVTLYSTVTFNGFPEEREEKKDDNQEICHAFRPLTLARHAIKIEVLDEEQSNGRAKSRARLFHVG